MSNHEGGDLLNKIIKVIGELGWLETASEAQKDQLVKKLWSLCWKHDCNWGEIIDEQLSEELDVCAGCGKRRTKRDKYGRCIGDNGNGCYGC